VFSQNTHITIKQAVPKESLCIFWTNCYCTIDTRLHTYKQLVSKSYNHI